MIWFFRLLPVPPAPALIMRGVAGRITAMDNPWRHILDDILPRVRRPVQYIGGEINSVVKDHAAAEVTIALAFPDTYTIGMSHLGLPILYHILNARDDVAAERAFAPQADMEAELRRAGLPLTSLETHTPLHQFDIVGFSLQYEMCYSTVPAMLDLGGIPLLSAGRGAGDPLVIAGGPCALNPEPMAGFIDAFVIGDGEEALPELIDAFKQARAAGASRAEMLHYLATHAPAVYVPSLYDVSYHPDGTVAAVEPKHPDVPRRVSAAAVLDLDAACAVEKPIVPFAEVVHDRVTLEIMRGCSQGCRFCHAGMTKRPVRARSVDVLMRRAESCIAASGFDEISLASLSSSDYPHLRELLARLCDRFHDDRVSIAMPSLRVDSMLSDLPESISKVRKSGITIAPEAATERLRRVINKNITDDDLFRGVRAAYGAGYHGMKLYFMLGLPTETLDDVRAIAELSDHVARMHGEVSRGAARINISVAPFVPKPHTPFQWEPMLPLDDIAERQALIRRSLRIRSVQLKAHNAQRSFLEGVFARGSRRVGAVILRAFELGCRLDPWDETFRFDYWMQAFAETGIDPERCNGRERAEDEVLPWDHIDAGVCKRFLLSERHRAQREETTPDCRTGPCRLCGREDICPHRNTPPNAASGAC